MRVFQVARGQTSACETSSIVSTQRSKPALRSVAGTPFEFARLPMLASSGPLQAKLQVNTPGDRYEMEADAVADRVMRMSDPSQGLSAPLAIQRLAMGSPAERGMAHENRARSDLQRACAACETEEEVQRVAAGPIDSLGEAEAKVAAVQGGRPPTRAERSFFEPRFGFDFSGVRIHTGPTADAAARSVGALAYTRGRDIVFREGSYAPGTESGRRLLAHEFTHVVQQGAAGSATSGSIPSASVGEAVQRTVDEDGKEMGPEPGAQPGASPSRRPALSTEEAERVGREALATMGYHEILRHALGAGILKPAGASEGQGQVRRAPDPGLIQRQDFATVFSRYAVAAGIASQVDSPAPGPGDVVAIGILVVGLFAALSASSTRRACPPCPTPPGPDIDRVPPSAPHFPCPGDHWHYYEYNQNPVTCQCFGPRRLFGGCCMGLPGTPC